MEAKGFGINWRSKDRGRGFRNKLEFRTWRKRVLKYIGGPRMEVEDSGI